MLEPFMYSAATEESPRIMCASDFVATNEENRKTASPNDNRFQIFAMEHIQ